MCDHFYYPWGVVGVLFKQNHYASAEHIQKACKWFKLYYQGLCTAKSFTTKTHIVINIVMYRSI